ncbi:MAG: FAD-binding oxidoreductase [bacterium]|nr:FAD-binding oxidoreductase [bacterium]
MVSPFFPETIISDVEVLQTVLQTRIQGQVIVPGEEGYDAARMVWNLSFMHEPKIIVVALNTQDVAEAVRFAAANNMSVGVQATGHGFSRAADDMLIITSQMTGVHINPENQTAWVEGGAKWGRVLPAAQEHGLAPLLGSTTDVGAVGYTLGGGMGWLARKYGLSADNVNAFEIVTAEGDIRRASATENTDLFWALRGGGAGFGVVTGMEIRLVPVSEVYAGNLFYPGAVAKQAFQFFREWTASAPDELTSSIAVMNFPPFPEVPEFLRGQTMVVVKAAYAGSMEDGAAQIQPWLEWMQPIVNTFRPLPFIEADSISNDPTDPTPALASTAWLADLSDEAIDTILDYVLPKNGPPAFVFMDIRHAGGAMARVAPDATAYSNRDGQLLLEMVAITPSQEIHEAAREIVAAFKRDLRPHMTGGIYLNFTEGEERFQSAADAFRAENLRRLQAIKAQVDPENRFRHALNYNAKKQ